MTQNVVVSKPNPHLPHGSSELQSPPPPDASTPEVAQKNAELIISQLMREEEALHAPLVLTPAQRREFPEGLAQAGAETRAESDAPSDARVEAEATADAPAGCAGCPAADPLRAAEAELRAALVEDTEIEADEETGRRLAFLRPRYILAVAGVILALNWPVLVGAVALLVLWLVVAGLVMLRNAVADGRWQRLARRHPRMAEALRRVADGVAERLDVALDLLPARWAESLALPDLSQPVQELRHDH